MLLITDERAGKVRHLQDAESVVVYGHWTPPMCSSGLNEKTLKGYVWSCFFLHRLLIRCVDYY